jgi:hypothetical protein
MPKPPLPSPSFKHLSQFVTTTDNDTDTATTTTATDTTATTTTTTTITAAVAASTMYHHPPTGVCLAGMAALL